MTNVYLFFFLQRKKNKYRLGTTIGVIKDKSSWSFILGNSPPLMYVPVIMYPSQVLEWPTMMLCMLSTVTHENDVCCLVSYSTKSFERCAPRQYYKENAISNVHACCNTKMQIRMSVQLVSGSDSALPSRRVTDVLFKTYGCPKSSELRVV